MNKKDFNTIKILIIIIFVVSISIFIIGKNQKNNFISDTKLHLKNTTNSYSLFIQNELNINVEFLKSFGDATADSIKSYIDDPTNPDSTNLVEVFSNVFTSKNMISSVYFVDNSTGVGVNHKGFIKKEDMKVDLRTRSWYIEASKSKAPIITDVYKDINNSKPCITISYALRKDNTLLGVISIDLLLEQFYSYYHDVTVNDNSDIYIFSPSGQLILHKKQELLGFSFIQPQDEYLSNLKVNKVKVTKEHTRIWNEMKANINGEIQYKNLFKENIFGYYNTLPSLDWKIVFIADNTALQSHLYHNFLLLIVIGIAISVILMWLARFYLNKYYNEDFLTGLNTKYKFLNELNKKSIHPKTNIMLFISITNLNCIKTQYGNIIGNEVLKNYTVVLKELFTKKATIVHSGEEDFILLFHSLDLEDEINYIKNNLDKLQYIEFDVSGNNVRPQSFLCLLEFTSKEMKNINKTLPKTEEIISKLKHEEKTFIHASLNDLLTLEDEDNKKIKFLQNSIKEDNITPFYQPLLDLKTNKIEKYEVLMRINDGRDYLSPFPYILLAEKNNLIADIDLTILEKALKYKSEIDKENKLIFSFNISGKVINDVNYFKKATSIVDKYNINHENILFEITETENVYDITKLIKRINHYKKQGYNFSIDDFGTGYSSISYLKKLPVDYLKIDGSFIKDINENEQNLYLVKSIVNMGKAFNKKIVAEFVESKEILDTIKALNIDFAQGYYIDKPQISIEMN